MPFCLPRNRHGCTQWSILQTWFGRPSGCAHRLYSQTSAGSPGLVSRLSDQEGIQSLIQTACRMAWDHRDKGSDLYSRTSFASAIIEWARLLIVRFVHSETPFSCGVYTFVTSCLMPCSAKYALNAPDVYSPLPSVCRILRLLPVSFSALAFQALNTPSVSSLDLQSLICM